MASFRETIAAVCELLKGVAEEKRAEISLQPELFSAASVAAMFFTENDMIEAFVNHSHQHWDNIMAKKTTVIMDHFSDILGVSASLIPPKEDWETMILALGEEKTTALWALIHNLVTLSLKHIHLHRRHDGQSYTVTYLPEVKVRPYAEKLSLKL